MSIRRLPFRRPDRIPEASSRGAYDEAASIHLANVLVHRLGSLVSGIAGFTDLLLERLGEAEERALAMRILESAQRIEHVLSDVTHFTRPATPEVESLDIGVLVEDTLRVLPDELAGRVAVDLSASTGRHVVADPYMTRDALLHLLQNAADGSDASEPVRLTVSVEGATVCFDVENAGRIDADTVTRMFEPFYTTKARNLGVGLTIARRFARVLGGDVACVGDASGDHVVFRLTLPLSRLTEAA